MRKSIARMYSTLESLLPGTSDRRPFSQGWLPLERLANTTLRCGRVFALAVAAGLPLPAHAGTWNIGDVFLGMGYDGGYQVRDPSGVLKDTLIDDFRPHYSSTGCILDRSGTLYTTNFAFNRVVVYSGNHPHPVLQAFSTPGVTPPDDNNNESFALDATGNLYVSHPKSGGELHRYTLSGVLLQEYPTGGTDWIDLAVDQRTMFYTQEGRQIKRYDVLSDTPLPDFATLPVTQPGNDYAYALRILPPGDGSNGVLVADSSNIKRLDGNGMVVQTYDLPGDDLWFALSLDPDGKSFWAGDIKKYYRFDLDSGALLGSFDTNLSDSVGGICVFGEIRAAEPCGNGRLDPGEECDDGNRLPGDGCDAYCRRPPCAALSSLPEANPTSLRVTKTGAMLEDLAVSFDTSTIPAQADHLNVYRGTIAAFTLIPPYDHSTVPWGCRLTSSPYIDYGKAAHGKPNVYYLIVAGCPAATGEIEGPYGYRWDGSTTTPRPSARDLGTQSCR